MPLMEGLGIRVLSLGLRVSDFFGGVEEQHGSYLHGLARESDHRSMAAPRTDAFHTGAGYTGPDQRNWESMLLLMTGGG